jgi:hypothetical protein
MKNFKEKGFAYERKLARILGEWWCHDPKALWRNTNSGARATVVGQVYGGDIIPANGSCGAWPLCIEIKKAEGWSIEEFLNGNPGNLLLAHMMQCLSSSQLGCNKIPILICKKNHRKPLVFLYKYKTRNNISHVPFLSRLKWQEPIPSTLANRYPWNGKKPDFYILHLDAFLRYFHREDFL